MNTVKKRSNCFRIITGIVWLMLAGCGGSSGPSLSGQIDSISSDSREVSFDEGWKFHLGDVSGAHAAEFDDSSWRSLDLPHDWQIEDLPSATSDDGGATAVPDGAAYLTHPQIFLLAPRQIGPFDGTQNDPTPLFGGRAQGWTVVNRTGWYRKRFDVSGLPSDSHVELRFDGIYQQAEIWVNGVSVATNDYGYVPIYVDITPHLDRVGPNVVAVRVNTLPQPGRWYTGSGIYRHTWLTITRSVRIPTDAIFITTPEVSSERSVVRVQAQVTNLGRRSEQAGMRITLTDPQGRKIATTSLPVKEITAGNIPSDFATEFDVSNPALWSTESPNLYRAHVEVVQAGQVIDRVSTSFGIRSIAVDAERGLLLNGEPIKIRGANVHHDHGPLGAVSLYRSEERRLELLKAAGFNAYRTAHNPHSREVLEICDRLGLLVYNEFVDAWDVPKGGTLMYPNFAQRWRKDIDTFVRRDRNHPSVIIWGIGNEIFVDATLRGPEIAAAVRAIDPTRLIARGGFNDPITPQYTDLGDEHYKTGTDFTVSRTLNPDRVIVHSESYPASIYDDWAFEEANPWLIGNFVWTGWDHIGEAGVGTPVVESAEVPGSVGGLAGLYPYPWYLSYAGDLDLIGQRKPQNYWRQVIYGMTPVEMMVERPLPGGRRYGARSWSYYDEMPSWTWNVATGTSMRVRVYTSGDSVELLLNGASLGTKPVTEADKMRVTFDVPYSPGELVAVARMGGSEIGRTALTTVGPAAAIRLTSDVMRLTTSRDDLAHVLVEVVDDQGRRVPDAVVKVAFDVSGAGKLVGVANANPHNVDSFQRPRRHTYHGRALAILRPAKAPGLITLRATANGLAPATLVLPVEIAR